MRFLVDNSLSPRIAELLVRHGHDALHVHDLGMSGADDQAIFDHAANDERVVVAQDVDFGTILALRQAVRPSVLLFRLRQKSPMAIGAVLLANLAGVLGELESGALVVIEDSRIRSRRLPLVH